LEVVVVLENVKNVNEREEKECGCCVKWKEELNSVVIELGYIKAAVKMLKEDLEIIGIEVRNGVGTIKKWK
jgi:hypothetical protein